MSEKTRLFRSLLLEPLECRSVFSVDGMEVWQYSHPTSNYDFDQFQPAQSPRDEALVVEQQGFATKNKNIDRLDDGEKFGQRRGAHGPSMRRGRLHDSPLPPADGEGPSFDNHPVLVDKTPSQIPTSQSPDKIVGGINLPSASTPLSQPPEIALGNLPRIQPDASSSSIVINRPGSIAGANSSPDRGPERAPNSILQNVPASASVAPLSYTGTQVNLASSSASSLSSGTTTFDLTSRPGVVSERQAATSLSGRSADDFRFTKPQSVPGRDSIVDESLVERIAGLKSLESLLSDLAENHRRGRSGNRFDADRPNSRGEQNWRPESAATVETAFADGGMIALALDRDIGLCELEDISEDARDESKAWIANVGIYRGFENGAVAATEYAALTHRMTRSGGSSSAKSDLTEVEAEVANSQLRDLLTSTTVAVGAVMIGLRRIRKFTPLMFTARKR